MNVPARFKILVVDDDAVTRLALSGLLRRIAGADIVEATDGDEAWALLEAGLRPVVCCSDIVMPNLTGLELLERTRAHAVLKHLPVVLVTSASDRDTVQVALQHRPAGYIIKPFAGAQTRSVVERVIRETWTNDAERPLATRGRLNLDTSGLARLLDTLLQSVARERDALETTPPDADLGERHERLRTACATLGLWRAANVLEMPPAGPARLPALQAILTEVAALAAQQRSLVCGECTTGACATATGGASLEVGSA